MEETRAQSTFDRFHGMVDGMPGVVTTKPSAIKTSLPIVGGVTIATVQTFKSPEFGFAITVTLVDADGQAYNHILPNKVALAIYRQRQSLTDRSTPQSRARKRASNGRKRRKAEKDERSQRRHERNSVA